MPAHRGLAVGATCSLIYLNLITELQSKAGFSEDMVTDASRRIRPMLCLAWPFLLVYCRFYGVPVQ